MILPGHLKRSRVLFHANFQVDSGNFNFTNKVVATKTRKRNPNTITYQLSLKPRILLTTCLTCSAPSFPKVFEMFSINPRPMLPRPINKPNSCDSIKTIGGNANVVKKAVAPAIRIGSFFPSNTNECRRLVNNSVNSLPFVLFSVMIQTKIKRCFSSVLSSSQGLTNNLQMFRSKTKDPDIPGLLLVFYLIADFFSHY